MTSDGSAICVPISGVVQVLVIDQFVYEIKVRQHYCECGAEKACDNPIHNHSFKPNDQA